MDVWNAKCDKMLPLLIKVSFIEYSLVIEHSIVSRLSALAIDLEIISEKRFRYCVPSFSALAIDLEVARMEGGFRQTYLLWVSGVQGQSRDASLPRGQDGVQRATSDQPRADLKG